MIAMLCLYTTSDKSSNSLTSHTIVALKKLKGCMQKNCRYAKKFYYEQEVMQSGWENEFIIRNFF